MIRFARPRAAEPPVALRVALVTVRAALVTLRAALVAATAGLLGVVAAAAPASAQQRACPHPEHEREAIARTLTSAPSCRAAHDLMNACRSNTGGDVDLAEIVITRCEAEFVSGLTPRQRQAYQEEREACRRRYARSRGTMYVSFGATCEAGVAAQWAARQTPRSRSR